MNSIPICPPEDSETTTDISESGEEEVVRSEDRKLYKEYLDFVTLAKQHYGHPYSIRRMVRNAIIESFPPIPDHLIKQEASTAPRIPYIKKRKMANQELCSELISLQVKEKPFYIRSVENKKIDPKLPKLSPKDQIAKLPHIPHQKPIPYEIEIESDSEEAEEFEENINEMTSHIPIEEILDLITEGHRKLTEGYDQLNRYLLNTCPSQILHHIPPSMNQQIPKLIRDNLSLHGSEKVTKWIIIGQLKESKISLNQAQKLYGYSRDLMSTWLNNDMKMKRGRSTKSLVEVNND